MQVQRPHFVQHVSISSYHPDGIQQYCCQPAYWREQITSKQTVPIFLADYFHVFISVFLLPIHPISLNCRNNSFSTLDPCAGIFLAQNGPLGSTVRTAKHGVRFWQERLGETLCDF